MAALNVLLALMTSAKVYLSQAESRLEKDVIGLNVRWQQWAG